MTRNTQSGEARALAELPNMALHQGNPYDESDIQNAYKGVQLAFANTNGFAIGEKAEIYWGIRLYELAVQNRLEHFRLVWSRLWIKAGWLCTKIPLRPLRWEE
jgi:hypothetical protein